MHLLGIICGIAAAALHLIAYAIYGRLTLRGQQPINPATWGLWTVLVWLNASSYLLASGDFWKAVGSFVSSLACTAVFLLGMYRRSTVSVDRLDVFLIVTGLSTTGAWWYWRDATLANLLLQVALTISMVPTYRRLLRDGSSEQPLPWLLWGSAYVFVLAAVLLRWTGHWADLVYPILNGVTHSGVGLIAVRHRRHSVRPS